MQFLDIYIIVIPALRPEFTGFAPHFFAVTAFIGIGGILAWLFLQKLGQATMFPTRDPRLAESIKLTN
jgi:hypothetical protein